MSSMRKVVLALLATLATPAGAADLTYGSWARAGEHINAVALTNAFKVIGSKTSGRINWNLVAGGQLGDGKSTYQAVQQGVMQGGLGVATFVPNLTPNTFALFSTLLDGDDVVAANGAIAELYLLHCPGCLDEFKKINTVPLAGFTIAPFAVYCRDPVASTADLKGKRVRALGGGAELIRMAGGAPVGGTPPEALTLIQRGGLDCVWGAVEWLKTFGFGEVAKNVLDYPMGMNGPAMAWMINRDAWNGFSAEDKRLHLDQAAYVTAEIAIGGSVLQREAIAKEMKESGVKFVKPADDTTRQLMENYKKLEVDRVVATVAKFGVKDVRGLIELYQSTYEKWKTLSKDIGRDVDKFAAVLKREVYDRVDAEKF